MLKVINNVTRKHMKSYGDNFCNIDILIYITAVTLKKHPGETYTRDLNEKYQTETT